MRNDQMMNEESSLGNDRMNHGERSGKHKKLGLKIGCVLAAMQIFFCRDSCDNMRIYVPGADYEDAEGALCQRYEYAGLRA